MRRRRLRYALGLRRGRVGLWSHSVADDDHSVITYTAKQLAEWKLHQNEFSCDSENCDCWFSYLDQSLWLPIVHSEPTWSDEPDDRPAVIVAGTCHTHFASHFSSLLSSLYSSRFNSLFSSTSDCKRTVAIELAFDLPAGDALDAHTKAITEWRTQQCD